MSKPEGHLDIWSIVSGKDGKPYVQFRFDDDHKFQLSPDEARAHANRITEVSFAADADAFLVDFLHKKVGVEMEKAVSLLQDFRKWREEKKR